jgi:hypothetical protein
VTTFSWTLSGKQTKEISQNFEFAKGNLFFYYTPKRNKKSKKKRSLFEHKFLGENVFSLKICSQKVNKLCSNKKSKIQKKKKLGPFFAFFFRLGVIKKQFPKTSKYSKKKYTVFNC